MDRVEWMAKIQSTESAKRLRHTLSMTDMAVSLAECYGIDTELTWITGMLHDIAKDMSLAEMTAVAERYGHKVSDFSRRFPANMHAEVGTLIAEHEFGLKDQVALNAIRYPVSARPDMSVLEKIIYFSDFAEPGRPNYAMMQYLYRIARTNIDVAILRALPILLSYQQQHHMESDICEILYHSFVFLLQEWMKRDGTGSVASYSGVETLSDAAFDAAFAVLQSNGLNLKSVKNVRSLGGFATKDGRRVSPGQLFRSGDLSRLSETDAQRLKGAAGLSLVIDMRSEAEAAREPDIRIPGVRYVHIPLARSVNTARMDTLKGLYQNSVTDKERAWYLAEFARIDEIRRIYAGIFSEPDSRQAIRKIFETILNEDGGVLFHCTSGKDRTGIISAILLYALGCERKDIISDYNASAVVYMSLVESLKADLKEHGYGEELQVGVQTILGVVPEVIAAGFYYIDNNYASDEDLLMDLIGFDRAGLQALRDKYLTPTGNG
ncbi:MAG: bis(5'-nucleosyl)-tetraphosphatase (symmetrical) YqeK [Clostridia bacterium]|nr:bis(5'-nucleosyl)-tetraphosphatase (symmetrical) YqeK [Clostridia bacterium]